MRDLSIKYMVETQIKTRGVKSAAVLRAMERVPRALFVPQEYHKYAYSDSPLPLHSGQTISQPYMVAAMTERLELDRNARVLEIGTGSGYQTAVLAEIASEVYTMEIIESLGLVARDLLLDLGYENIHFKIGDGYYGWPEAGPFDGVIVTAAPERTPPPLAAQLKTGGRMVIPIGPVGALQQLQVLEKEEDGSLRVLETMSVRFVPLTGEH